MDEREVLQRVAAQLDAAVYGEIFGSILGETQAAAQPLTVQILDKAKADLEAHMAVAVDAFVRLGEDGYRTYEMLTHGGGVLTRTEHAAMIIRNAAPNVNLRVRPWLPGEVFVISKQLWDSLLEGERRNGELI